MHIGLALQRSANEHIRTDAHLDAVVVQHPAIALLAARPGWCLLGAAPPAVIVFLPAHTAIVSRSTRSKVEGDPDRLNRLCDLFGRHLPG